MLPQETEIKFDLQNEKNYVKLIRFFNADNKAVEQSNSFFDTMNHDLSKQGWACRLRIENDRAFLTLKGAGKREKEGLAVRTEIEQELDMEMANDFMINGIEINNLPDEFKKLMEPVAKTGRLYKRVDFFNYRTSVYYALDEEFIVLEIDRTEFSDGSTDYELEVELKTKDNYRVTLDKIKDLFDILSIPVILQNRDKYDRALARA